MAEQPEPEAAASGVTSGGTKAPDGSGAPAWLMLFIYGGGAVLYAAWQFSPTSVFIREYWPLCVIAVVAVVAVFLLVKPAARSAGQTRVALVTFGLIPFVMLVITGVVILPVQYQAPALRAIFLSVVTLLPPTMYYLFISTRKYSLLNEFVSSLDRLGLLDLQPSGHEVPTEADERRHKLRVVAYLQKFEAAYGPLPVALMDEIRATGDVPSVLSSPRSARLLSSGVADVFTAETTPPLVISTVLIGLGWLAMMPPTAVSEWDQAFIPASMPVYYAFLGAYFFSIQMLFRRYVLRDLRTSAYVAISMRVILAVLGTWVLERAWAVGTTLPLTAGATQPVAPNQALLLIAFVVGVFPPVAWNYVQAVLKKVTFASVAVPSLTTQLPISDLDGLTVWHQSRFEEEDIENIPNMATANLVDLLLNTRVPPDRIIDWVDQAILYTQIGADDDDMVRRKKLRSCGIRTASALVDAYWRSLDEVRLTAATGEETPIALTVGSLRTNPNLKHIQRWRGLPEEPVLRV